MLLETYSHEMGKSCRTVAMMNLLGWHGLNLSEDVILGLCEGFDFSYVLPNKQSEHSLMKILSPNLNHFENLAKNLALEYQIITRNDFKDEILEDILTYEKKPVIAEVSLGRYTQYLGEDGRFLGDFSLDVPISLHITEIVGFDNEFIYTYENFSKQRFKVPREVFREARKLEGQTAYNPLHRIYRFQLPEDIQALDIKRALRNAIADNMDYYVNSQNEKLGYSAFKAFVRDYPNLKEAFPEEVVEKSLTNSGYLVKYVSPGLLRKQYARFMLYCSQSLGCEEEFNQFSSLLNKADFLWNNLAAVMIHKSMDLDEKLRGAKVTRILADLYDTEARFINGMGEFINKWKQ